MRFVGFQLDRLVPLANWCTIVPRSINASTGSKYTKKSAVRTVWPTMSVWGDIWWQKGLSMRDVLSSWRNPWWWRPNGICPNLNARLQYTLVLAVTKLVPFNNSNVPSKCLRGSSKPLFFNPNHFLNPFLLTRCHWPVCATNCSGLTDSNLHSEECEILSVGLAPRSSDVNVLLDYYRPDALLVLRCLLLQKHSPDKWLKLMDMQSHEEERLGTDLHR